MKNIYSKIDPSIIIFTVIKKEEIKAGRINLTPDSEYLQVGVKKVFNGEFFKPHKHLECNKVATKTQEAWVILNGSAKGTFYDLDDSYLCSTIINDGDCVVIYNGGHSLEVLADETYLYEFKNGPYHGVEKDKQFIEATNEQ